jgi:group I intron endonuclease
MKILEQAGIYRFRIDRPEGPMFYIGHASVLRKRRDKHLSELRRRVHKNERLQRAFDKYGECAFSFEVLLVCERSAVILQFFEQNIVDNYGRDRLYNLCLKCVGSKLGLRQTLEQRAKIGAKNKGRKLSDRQKESVRLSNMTRIVSDETRAKMSAARKGNKNALGHRQTDEHKEKVGAFFRGRKKDSEEINRRLAARRANAVVRGYY